MRLRTEVAIDVDKNRKLWLIVTADDVEPSDVEEVVEGMAGSIVDKAVKAYEAVGPKLPGKPDPADTPTFGDD